MRQLNLNAKIILEPESRNTAPAITLSAVMMDNQDSMLVLPADHVIKDKDHFVESIIRAESKLQEDYLVTFGVVPDSPHTGYGYIKKGIHESDAYKIESFHEKPEENMARQFYESGDYFWNSGMFLFKVSAYLSEVKNTCPEIYYNCKKSVEGIQERDNFIEIDANPFLECPNISIDYAVMEKTGAGVVIPINSDWNDVGSWRALWDVSLKDENNNSIQGDVFAQGVKNSFVRGSDKLLVLNSVKDLVVVDTKDSILISDKDDVSGLSDLMIEMKKAKRQELQLDRKVYRPWGTYENLDSGESHQVKRITVNPGAQLSLQSHEHRSEHWTIVSGVAEVTKDKEIFTLNVNESIFIPVGSIHSLKNLMDEDLVIIEVQCGDYLGEDDIKRYEDIYGRVDKE